MLHFVHMTTNYDFAEWLQNAAKARNLSQADIVRRSGLSTGGVSHLFNGTRGPGKEGCIALARALSIPEDTVLRIAGFKTDPAFHDERVEELIHLFSLMSEEQREEFIRSGWLKIEVANKYAQKRDEYIPETSG